jgi:hypothetical protein
LHGFNWRKLSLAPLVALVCIAADASADVIKDGDFSSWSFDTTGTGAMTREPIGGNPGARLNVTTISGPAVFATGIKTDYTTNAALAGLPFTLSLDVLSGPGDFGQGQAIQLLVKQGSAIYGEDLNITGFPHNFDTLTFNGTFDEASFVLLLGSGPSNPDFSGSATSFGFAAGNSGSGTLTSVTTTSVYPSRVQSPSPPAWRS